MKKLFLLLTCSLATSFLSLTLHAQSEQAQDSQTENPALVQADKSAAQTAQDGQDQDNQAAEQITSAVDCIAPAATESASSASTATQAAVTLISKKDFRKLTSGELAAQYIASCLFGALTGTGCHFVEKHNLANLHGPWSWMLEYALRAGVMRTVEEDMENNRDIKLAPGAFKIAWASSWIAYLTAKYLIAETPVSV